MVAQVRNMFGRFLTVDLSKGMRDHSVFTNTDLAFMQLNMLYICVHAILLVIFTGIGQCNNISSDRPLCPFLLKLLSCILHMTGCWQWLLIFLSWVGIALQPLTFHLLLAVESQCIGCVVHSACTLAGIAGARTRGVEGAKFQNATLRLQT